MDSILLHITQNWRFPGNEEPVDKIYTEKQNNANFYCPLSYINFLIKYTGYLDLDIGIQPE